jgi:hypothetical protein
VIGQAGAYAGEAMRALWVCLVLFGVGCASDGPKEQWSNFKKDMSDDIILKSDFTQTKGTDLVSAPAKSHN